MFKKAMGPNFPFKLLRNFPVIIKCRLNFLRAYTLYDIIANYSMIYYLRYSIMNSAYWEILSSTDFSTFF